MQTDVEADIQGATSTCDKNVGSDDSRIDLWK